MTFFLRLASGLLLGLAACSEVQPVQPAASKLAPTKAISFNQVSLIEAHARPYPNHTQLSIALLSDTSAVFFGIERRQDTLHAIDNRDLVFEIGSITKVFTATLLAQLVGEGAIALDDPIGPVLPFEMNSGAEITFRQLANHTSGLSSIPPFLIWSSLRNPKNPYKLYTEEKLQKYLSKKLEWDPEDAGDYAYSNLGAGVLGYALTHLTDSTYEQLLQGRLFEPLAMSHSTTKRTTVTDRLVAGRDTTGREVPNWDLNVLESAGAVLSTTSDLARFARVQWDTFRQNLMLTRQPTHRIGEDMAVGLGWHILYKGSSGQDIWHWHNGGTGGYRSSMAVDVANRRAVIVLSNATAMGPHAQLIDDLCFALMETL